MQQQSLDVADLEDYIWVLTKLKETTLALPNYQEEVVDFISVLLSVKKNRFSQEEEKKPAH